MSIMSLGYVGVEAAKPQDWGTFAERVLGAPVAATDADGTRYVRVDERSFRIAIHPGADGRLAYLGWEVADAETLEAMAARLRQHDVPYAVGSADECRRRGAMGMISFRDTEGMPNELFYGGDISAEPFRPTRDISGFVALGHVVLGVRDMEPCERFYRDVLGFKVSDYIEFPWGDISLRAVFMRARDGREHSVALQNVGEGIHHALLEVKSMDDLGRTLDACMDNGIEIAESLGRHSNDLMISFYMVSPNGMQIECGYGGIKVDDATWRVRHMNAGSLWGHRVAAK